MTAAVIAARGGSIRIPRKNLKLFCGLPLMAWSIIQAKASQSLDWVYLSTDDDEIAEVGEAYGAEIIRRPDWPDADTASGGRPLKHALTMVPEIDVMVTMLPTMPCRYPNDIDRMVAMREKRGVERIAPFTARRESYLYNKISDGWVRRAWTLRDPQYHDHACGMGAVTREAMLTDTVISSSKSDAEMWAENYGMVMPPEAFIEFELFQTTDCDTLKEWEWAELVMEHYLLKGRGRAIYDNYARSTT